ncbi:MAG: PAS domain S-box protein [Stellaceae bacterium]
MLNLKSLPRRVRRFISITTILIAGYVAMALIAVFIGYAAFRQSQATRNAAHWVTHTEQIIEAIQELQATVLQAESSSLGFMLSGNNDFLKIYNDDVGKLDVRIANLRALTADNPNEHGKIDRLAPLIAQKRALLDHGIEVRQTRGLAEIAGRVSSLRGKNLMDDITAAVRNMMAEEQSLLLLRVQNDARADRDKRIIVFFALGLALVVGMIAGIAMLRYIFHRRKAERQLAEQSSLLSTTIENIPQGISVFDPELRLLAWNRRYGIMFGYPQELLRIGVSLRELLENRGREGGFGSRSPGAVIDAELEQARSRVPHSFERTQPDGQVVEIRGEFTPDGKLVTTFTDITERRQAEEKLRRFAAFQQSILDCAADAIIATNAEGKITLFNKEAEQLLAYPAAEVVGKHNLADFLLPDELDKRAQELSSGTSEHIPPNFYTLSFPALNDEVERREWTFVRKDGIEFPAVLSMSVLRGGGGVFGYLALASDISAQKEAERKIRHTATRLKAIFDNALDGIITINESGSIESFSATAEKIFDYRAHEVLQRNIKLLMPEPYHTAHDGYLRNYLATGERKIIGTRREVEGKRKDGVVFPMELAVNEMWLGKQRLFVGMVRDITEQKKVERLKNEFVSTVSHELRTPLTSIAGSLGLLVGGAAGALPERVAHLIGIAHSNIKRLMRLVNDILDIEKIESGKMTFSFAAVPLRPLVEHCIEANRGYADTYNVRFELGPAAANSIAIADPDRMTQVVTNLLSNAVKFSPANGTVDVGIEQHGDRVCISVRDHGPGIPEEFRSRIFQKFAQADSSDTRQKGGTGLGLAIVRSIVERHGGSIDFDSVIGEGTTFNVRLPIWRESIPDAAESSGADGLHRLLICEDDPDIASLLAMMLQQAGFGTDVAHSADEATAKLAQGAYAALVLDIRLPDRDGITLIRELRRQEATRCLPVIIVSAYVQDGTKIAGVETLGIADWLEKPIDSQRLVQTAQSAIHHRRDGRPRVLHIEDDPDVLSVVRIALVPIAEVSVAKTVAEARAVLRQGNFDLVILDLTLPDGSGLDLLPLRDHANHDIPAIIFSAQDADNRVTARVSAALVKSRTSINQLVASIKWLLEPAEEKAKATTAEQAQP